MKKCFIIPLLVMMLLLVGCAKAVSNKTSKSASNVSTAPKAAEPTTAAEKVPDNAIEWKDEKFEAVIRKLLNKPQGDIMLSEVRDIEKLDCSNAGIINADDLTYFENLKEADLSHNGLTNLGNGLVNKFSRLVKLDLSYNHIFAINLSLMPNLQYLNLQENQIEYDLSSLADSKELTYLNLNNSGMQNSNDSDIFTDISALSGLTKLTFLDLGNIKTIEDYSCLSNLNNLQELNLEKSNISNEDLQYIKGMKKLTKLNLKNTEDATLTEAIKELTSLTTLYANCDGVNDMLQNFKNMEELCLNFKNDTIDLKFLKNMPNLKKLTLANAEIDDPSPLTKLPCLTYLDLKDAYVNGTECISKMTQLEELYYNPCRSAERDDLEYIDISGLTNLKSLFLTESGGETNFKMSQLNNMKNLQKLELSSYYNPGFDQLKNLPQIKELTIYLEEGYDGNLNFLKDLPQLTSLNLGIDSALPITDYTPLKALVNLKELVIYTESESANNIAKVVSGMKQLTSLFVETEMKNTDFLKGLQNLETLILYVPGQEKAVDIASLAELHKLKTLDISNIRIDDISVLGKSKSLSTLIYNINNEPGNLKALEEAIPYLYLEKIDI